LKPLESALYEGTVEHRRTGPVPHAFRYSMFLSYIDLAELDRLFDGPLLWSLERPNVVSFRRADFLGDPAVPLREAVLERVETELGRRPSGPVRMLTQLRTFGYVFNPVTFYYCYARSGRLDAVVAEITNTPWRERHAYVLDAREGGEGHDGNVLRWRFDKNFHVSPFFDMDQVYEWSFRVPGERLEVGMVNHEQGEAVFDVGLTCRRKPLTARSLARVLMRYPLMTMRVHLAIYWQALRLYLKRTPFFTHPDKRAALPDTSTS